MKSNKFIAIVICIISSFIINLYAGDASKITYSKSIQIILNTGPNSANINEDMGNLPVFIKLNASNFDFDVIKEGLAGDITISIGNGSFLPYKVKKIDKAGKSAEILIVIPRVWAENSTQSITLLYGKNTESITDQVIKEKVEEIILEEISSQSQSSTLFKDSYAVYGVWTSNNENGFIIIE